MAIIIIVMAIVIIVMAMIIIIIKKIIFNMRLNGVVDQSMIS